MIRRMSALSVLGCFDQFLKQTIDPGYRRIRSPPLVPAKFPRPSDDFPLFPRVGCLFISRCSTPVNRSRSDSTTRILIQLRLTSYRPRPVDIRATLMMSRKSKHYSSYNNCKFCNANVSRSHNGVMCISHRHLAESNATL